MNQCTKHVYGGGRGFLGGQCDKPGKVLVDGKWLCGIHSPEAVQKRKDKFEVRYDAHTKAMQTRMKDDVRRQALLQACEEAGIMTAEELRALLPDQPIAEPEEG